MSITATMLRYDQFPVNAFGYYVEGGQIIMDAIENNTVFAWHESNRQKHLGAIKKPQLWLISKDLKWKENVESMGLYPYLDWFIGKFMR